jgi:hypothetical protein
MGFDAASIVQWVRQEVISTKLDSTQLRRRKQSSSAHLTFLGVKMLRRDSGLINATPGSTTPAMIMS